jgi:tRNA(fMet)-specific endonuclease VapC
MKYLLDTNILIIYIRDQETKTSIENKFHPFDLPNIPLVSIVSIGELESFALRNKWGEKRLSSLALFLKQVVVVDINSKDIVKKYAEIDAFSQGKLDNNSLGMSARNMGKNDLWIAATACVADAILLTADKDFEHLDNRYLNLEIVELS